jgi:hypothetical protein
MGRKNLHILDMEMVDNIINMINSGQEENIRLALIIINNTDLNDFETSMRLTTIMHSCDGLCFSFFTKPLSRDIVIKYHYDSKGLFIANEPMPI